MYDINIRDFAQYDPTPEMVKLGVLNKYLDEQ